MFPKLGEKRCESNPELAKAVKWFNRKISWSDHVSDPTHRTSIAAEAERFNYKRAISFCNGSSLTEFGQSILKKTSKNNGIIAYFYVFMSFLLSF